MTMPCNITLLSVSGADSVRRLIGGFAGRAIREADAVMTLDFGGTISDFARRQRAKRVVSLSTYRKLNSAEEDAINLETGREISRIANKLEDIQLSRTHIGQAWAIGLRSHIFRELYAAYTLDRVLDEGITSLTIICGKMSFVENAIIARLRGLHLAGSIVFNGTAAIQGDMIQIINEDRIGRVRNALYARKNSDVTIPAKLDPETLIGDFNSIRGEHPTKADVIFLHMYDHPMYMETLPPILDELEKRKIPAAALVTNNVSQEIYEDRKLGEKRNVAQLNHKLELQDNFQLERFEAAIRERIELSAVDMAPISCWVSLFAVHSPTYMRRSLQGLFTFLAALNVMIGRTKAKSLFLPHSPAVNPFAFLALSASDKRLTAYYCFSAIMTRNSVSIPFIPPAILLASGQHEIEMLSIRNSSAGDMAILTGSPSLDHLFELAGDISKHARSEKPVVTIATSRSDPDSEDIWLRKLVDWAVREDVELIFAEKHRRGGTNFDLLAKKVKKAKDIDLKIISERNEISRYMIESDIIITDKPSLAYLGIFAGTPIIQAAFDAADLVELEEGVGFVANSSEEIIDILQGLILDPDYIPREITERRMGFLEKLVHQEGGSAAEKVVDALIAETEYQGFNSPFTEILIPHPQFETGFKAVISADFSKF